MIKKVSSCKICKGFGLWAMGDALPMGAIDAMEGYYTVPCPSCGANVNPIPKEDEEKIS